MTFNIAKQLNYDLLDKKIDTYKIENNTELPYIFLNSETADEMSKYNFNNEVINCSKTIFEYMGCKVYLDDDLEYGTIVLR